MKTNNSCLEIANNRELEKFLHCEELTLENNLLQCSKCKNINSLIKKNNVKECTYIRILYDYKLKYNIENHFYFTHKGEVKYNDFLSFNKSDYIYHKYKDYYPCQEAENLGKEDNPIYSCTKCYEYYGDKNLKNPVRITEEKTKTSFCIYQGIYEELKDCTEALVNYKNGKKIFTCTKCIKNYVLTLNKFTNTYYCQFNNATTKCLVLFCKTCNPYDGYICDECLPYYAKDSLTGYCVKHTDFIPAIIWKDVYRLVINGIKIINNKYIHGPKFRLRGITSFQINSRHSFLLYLTFQIKNRNRNRYLEEGKNSLKIKTICEVVEEVEESLIDINMVEYECICNKTNEENLTNYLLDSIEEGNNEKSLKKSNIKEFTSSLRDQFENLELFKNVQESLFTFEDLFKIVIFQMNEKIEKINAIDFKFDFKIEGKLNKDITSSEIITKEEFELYETDNMADCIFTIKSDKMANLNCSLNVENNKDIKTFSFKTSQIKVNSKEIYLLKLGDIQLINSQEEKEKEGENEKEEEKGEKEIEKGDKAQNEQKEKKSNKIIIIAVIIICVVIGIIGIGFGTFHILRRYNAKKFSQNNNQKEIPKMEVIGDFSDKRFK